MSLKNNYADEILESMSKALDSEEYKTMFKTASLVKEAGPALEAFKKDVDVNVGKVDLEQIYTKHLTALTQEENTEKGILNQAREYMASVSASKGGAKQPGMAFPPASADDTECACDESMAINTAADFAIGQLVKVADALDKKGFDVLASTIDEAIEKVAAKKKPMTFKMWIKKLTKAEGPVEKFEKVFNKCLEENKKEGMKKKEAVEKALEMAVSKLPKKFTVEVEVKKEKKEEKGKDKK